MDHDLIPKNIKIQICNKKRREKRERERKSWKFIIESKNMTKRYWLRCYKLFFFNKSWIYICFPSQTLDVVMTLLATTRLHLFKGHLTWIFMLSAQVSLKQDMYLLWRVLDQALDFQLSNSLGQGADSVWQLFRFFHLYHIILCCCESPIAMVSFSLQLFIPLN